MSFAARSGVTLHAVSMADCERVDGAVQMVYLCVHQTAGETSNVYSSTIECNASRGGITATATDYSNSNKQLCFLSSNACGRSCARQAYRTICTEDLLSSSRSTAASRANST